MALVKIVKAFVRDNEECPYEDFLNQVRKGAQGVGRILALVDRLREFGFELARNNCIDCVEGKIWELKPGPFRIFFFAKGDVFILLNGYRKKSVKIPRKHLDKARRLHGEAS